VLEAIALVAGGEPRGCNTFVAIARIVDASRYDAYRLLRSS